MHMTRAHTALAQGTEEKAMNESAARSPLVRIGKLKKGDVKLLYNKFCELDRNADRKLQWLSLIHI